MIPDITLQFAAATRGTEVAIHHLNQEATSRGARMLRTALGPPSRSGSKTPRRRGDAQRDHAR